MSTQHYTVEIDLARREDPSGAKYQLVLRTIIGGKYELTKEYDNQDECLKAFAAFVRKGTVESAGETPPEPETP